MELRSLRDIDVTKKTVLYRSPYDIGVIENNAGNYELIDDARIRVTLPTLQYLLEQECKIVILTYVKRPDGKVVEKLRTTPHAKRLSELLDHPVVKLDDCVGFEVTHFIEKMKPGDIVMLENTRFHEGEKEDDDSFAQELAKNGEVVVFDGFPQAHRAHASVTGIMRHLPSVAGFYLEKEVAELSSLTQSPNHPFIAIIGGAKISDKVGAIENLYDSVDMFLVGGGVANVFLAAEGKEMGGSYMEGVTVEGNDEDMKGVAQTLLSKELSGGSFQTIDVTDKVTARKIMTPYDLITTDSLDNPKTIKTTVAHNNIQAVEDGYAAVDIGPTAQSIFAHIISQAKSVFWNGPMGLVEDERFQSGTRAIAAALKNVKGTVVIGGGDTVSSVTDVIGESDVTYISLAGGATLEFLAGESLPALEMLKK